MLDPLRRNEFAGSPTLLRGAAGEQSHWYCRVFGTDLGPMPFEALRWMVESEQLEAGDLVRHCTTGPWHTVGDVAELRSLVKGFNSPEKGLAKTDPETKPVPPSDEWYYRLDGREHGPFTFAALQDLIGSSGETASDVFLRHALDGNWVSFFALPENVRFRQQPIRRDSDDSATEKPTQTDERERDVAVSTSKVCEPRRSLQQIARDNSDIAVAAIAWMLINAVISIASSQSYPTERNYFASLRSLDADVTDLQSRPASEQEWAVLRARAKQTLAPIVNDLKQTARASEPIRQHLLWAARDQLPKLIAPRTAKTNEFKQLYERHMRIVEQELAK
jgi:hypothetical protein